MVLKFTTNSEVFSPFLNNAAANNIVVTTGCQVVVRSPTIMGVRTGAGSVTWDGATVSVVQTDSTIDANATAFVRYDLIVINSSGTVSVVEGTAATPPLTPTYDNATYYVLAIIKVRAGTSTIETADIFDGRIVGTVSTGGVTSISQGTGIVCTPNPITATGTIAVDSGTTANKVVVLDASARIPAVNGSLITNLNGSNIASGTVADARLPTSLGAKTFTDDVTINTKIIPDTNGGADIGASTLGMNAFYIKDTNAATVYKLTITDGTLIIESV